MKPNLYEHNIPPVTRTIPPGETLVVCGPPVDTEGYAYIRSVVLFDAVAGSVRIEWGLHEASTPDPAAFSLIKKAAGAGADDCPEKGVSWIVIKTGPEVGRQRFIRACLDLTEGRQTPLTPPRGAVATFAVYMELYRPDSPMAAMYDNAERAAAYPLRGRFEAL